VLMHVPDAELFDAVFALRKLLKPFGRLLISLPLARDDLLEGDRDKAMRPTASSPVRPCEKRLFKPILT